MTTDPHILGIIALCGMAFMALFVLAIGIFVWRRNASTVSLVFGIIMCICFVVCGGLFFVGPVIGCTGALICCGLLLVVFLWRWACGNEKTPVLHIACILITVVCGVLIVLGYFN